MTDRIPRLRPGGPPGPALAALAGAGTRGGESRWVGTWAASPQRTEPANMPPAPGLADATLRQIVHVSLGGRRLTVRFSNAFGARPLTILAAHVATPAGGAAIRAESRKPLAFGGRSSVTIPPGAPVVSDPVDFDLAPLSDLAVTVRVKDPTDAVTGHPGARCTSYLQAGDAIAEPDLPRATRTPHWYYLCGVDVDASDAEAAAVAVLGDSITDGRGSPTDGNGRWTDHLARRLHGGRGDRQRRGPEPGPRRQPPPERRPGAECPGAPGSRRPGAAGRALADRPGGDQ